MFTVDCQMLLLVLGTGTQVSGSLPVTWVPHTASMTYARHITNYYSIAYTAYLLIISQDSMFSNFLSEADGERGY